MTSSVHAEHPPLDQLSVFTRLIALHWPKNFLVTIFESIVVKVKQIKQQTNCLAIFREASIKKKNFELRTPKFFIVCSFY